MAHKRAHNKSRNGCDKCKERHVKCDEKGPPCTLCSTRNTECHYSHPAPYRRPNATQKSKVDDILASNSSVDSPTHMALTAMASIALGSEPLWPSTRLRELELMHHWCTQTCKGFTTRLIPLFQGYVIQEALKHDFLMESILALTSLHVASQLDDQVLAAAYVSEGLQYQNNAVRPFHTALHNVTPFNCHAVFVCSIITMACAIVSPLLPVGSHDSNRSVIESFFPLFDFLKGIGTVVATSRETLQQGPLGVMFEMELAGFPEGEIRPPFHILRSLNNTVNSANDPMRHQIYDHAIEQLNVAAIITYRIVPWIGLVGETFVDELRSRKPLALIIFMYWGVLLNRTGIWWAKYAGKLLVEELSSDLNGLGKEWKESLAWATTTVASEKAD